MLTFWNVGSATFPPGKSLQSQSHLLASEACKGNFRKMKLVATAVQKFPSLDEFLRTYPRVKLNQTYTTIAGVIGSGRHSKPSKKAAKAAEAAAVNIDLRGQGSDFDVASLQL
jgi:hypothetical protein